MRDRLFILMQRNDCVKHKEKHYDMEGNKFCPNDTFAINIYGLFLIKSNGRSMTTLFLCAILTACFSFVTSRNAPAGIVYTIIICEEVFSFDMSKWNIFASTLFYWQ